MKSHFTPGALLLSASLSLCSTLTYAAPFAVTTPGTADNAPFSQDNASNVGECGGRNVSPPLRWNEPPAGTRSFAVLLHDPDGQKGLGVDHWVHYGLPADTRKVAAGAGGSGNLPGIGGKNSKGGDTYIGPCPPVGDSEHHYVIQLYALDLAPDVLEAGLSAAQVRERIKGHVLGNASVVRRYGR